MAGTILHGAVRRCEALLRQCYDVREFTGQPQCILRIAVSRADRDVHLSDGTAIGQGDPVIDLHWWNERLPPIPRHGPDIAWASAMNRRIGESLAALADYVGTQPTLSDIRAFRAAPAFGTRIGAPQMARYAQHFGFELVKRERRAELADWPRALGDSMLLWSLIWAFNPSGLQNKPFLRERYDLWASRQRLREWSAGIAASRRARTHRG